MRSGNLLPVMSQNVVYAHNCILDKSANFQNTDKNLMIRWQIICKLEQQENSLSTKNLRLINLSDVNLGNESVLIQLAQCWFPGLAISKAKI